MKVFSRPPHERSLECITKCIPILKKIKFFSQREIDDEEYMEIIKCMEISYYPKGNIMYEEGSFGREFHLIIMGKVTVCIKDPSKCGVGGGLRKFRAPNQKCFERANKTLKDTYEFMKMKAGDSFGESALVNDKPLQESVLCSTDCHIAILKKEKYEAILKKIEMKTRDGWISFFRTHPIFGDLTLVSLEKLFCLVELKFFTRNQPIFKEGDEVKGFYLIYRGEASLTKKVTK